MSSDLHFLPYKSNRISEIGTCIPDEVLAVIFENLKAPKDISCISQACHRFRNVINRQMKEWGMVQALPYILPYLNKEDILNCRLVGPLFCQRVDFILRTNCRPLPWNSPHSDKLSKIFKAKRFLPLRITSTLIYTALEEVIFDPQRNPFVTRWITIGYFGNFPEDYWCHVILFLTQFGHFIWHLNLLMSPFINSFDDSKTPQYYQIYELFLTILNLTPNLKSLELQFRHIPAKTDIHPANHFFKKFLQKNLIPAEQLNKIESLYLTGSSRYVQIQSSVLSQLSSQLEKIEIGGRLEESLKKLLSGGSDFSFDKLKDLSLKTTNPKKVIKLLGKIKAPFLRKIELNMEVSGSPQILEIFDAFKRFPLLECVWWHVEVIGGGYGVGGGNLTDNIEPLMKLRFLKICHYEGLPYKKMFKCMPMLEDITIFGRKRKKSRLPVEFESVIEMAKSKKLWKKKSMRKLERFSVKEFLGVEDTQLYVNKVFLDKSGCGRKKLLIYQWTY